MEAYYTCSYIAALHSGRVFWLNKYTQYTHWTKNPDFAHCALAPPAPLLWLFEFANLHKKMDIVTAVRSNHELNCSGAVSLCPCPWRHRPLQHNYNFLWASCKNYSNLWKYFGFRDKENREEIFYTFTIKSLKTSRHALFKVSSFPFLYISCTFCFFRVFEIVRLLCGDCNDMDNRIYL